jgi:hypothetical protein
MLREEIMLLHNLISEVVPVFSKITEDINEDSNNSRASIKDTSISMNAPLQKQISDI